MSKIHPEFFEDAHQSIIKWGIDFTMDPDIRDIADGVMKYHVWDAYGDQVDYPDDTLFGHSAFAMDTDGFVAAFNVSFGLSFVKDKNLSRHVKIISRLVSRLAPGEQVPFYRGTSIPQDIRPEASWLVVSDETQVLPVVRTTTRPVQFVQVTLLANPFLLGRTPAEIKEYQEED